MLSSNGLCPRTRMQHVQYVLLFLVLVVNSDGFQILWSYMLLLQSPNFMRSWCTTLASFPGPAQLFVAISTYCKRRKSGRGLGTRLCCTLVRRSIYTVKILVGTFFCFCTFHLTVGSSLVSTNSLASYPCRS